MQICYKDFDQSIKCQNIQYINILTPSYISTFITAGFSNIETVLLPLWLSTDLVNALFSFYVRLWISKNIFNTTYSQLRPLSKYVENVMSNTYLKHKKKTHKISHN